MKLFLSEMKKIWSKKEFLLYFTLLVTANIFLLWIDTQSSLSKASANSYKKLMNDISQMSESEKVDFIDSRYEMIHGIVKIDNIMQISEYSPEEAKKLASGEYIETFAKYYNTYTAGKYLRYTDSLYREYYFMDKIKTEIDTVDGYDEFIRDVQYKAEKLSKISIFSEEGGFDSLNIAATSEAYSDISNVEIDYYPQDGLIKAITFRYSDLILFLAMLLLSSYIIRDEKDSGMMTLIRTMPGGKSRTGLAKLAAMSVSLLVFVAAVYIVNLIYCNLAFGIGPLDRSIQSVPYLMRSTLRLNLFEYIVIFIFTKWIAAFICGIWVLISMLVTKRAFSGYIMAASVPAVSIVIRNAIYPTSHLNVIRYSNLISFLTTNEILGSYRNLYWFGKPVTIFRVEITAAALFAALFIIMYVIIYEKADISSSGKVMSLSLFKFRKGTTVIRQEWYKLLIMNGGLVILVLFGVFQIYSAYKSDSPITADEMFYGYYMKNITGSYDKESYKFLTKENEKFEPIYYAEYLKRTKQISSEEYSNLISANYALNMEYQVYQRVMNKVQYARKNGRQLVYETGYLKLFDFYGNDDITEYMLTALMCCVLFSGLFCMEKSSGMYKVISVTPLGNTYTVDCKFRITFITDIILTLAVAAPRFYSVYADYGFPGLTVLSQSISEMSRWPGFIIIAETIIIMLVFRFMMTYFISSAVLYISFRMSSYLSRVMFSLLIFELPRLLYYLGIGWTKYITAFTLFHAVPTVSSEYGLILVMIFSAACLIIYSRITDYIYTGFSNMM